jgi:Flp pilus assembly protein TadD
MSYQFRIEETNRSLRFPAMMMAAIVASVIAAYTFVACGDRSPDQAAAGEPVSAVTPTSSTTPAATAPAEKPALVISGPVSFEMADSAYRGRRYDDAAALFRAYTETRPGNAFGFYMLGLSAWKSGDRVTAESAFLQAIDLDSTHVKSRLNLSRVLLEGAQPESALVHIDAAIALDSTSSEPLRLQGRAFEAQGKFEDAIVAYRRAIELDETDVWAFNNLGALYIRLGQFQDAIEPLTTAVQLNDKVATFHNNLGMAFERTGRYRSAETEYRAALAIEGTYGKAMANLQRVELLKETPVTTDSTQP